MEQMTYSHDMLITILRERYPMLEHGRDFYVAHPVDARSGRQCGEPFIAVWRSTTIPQPDADSLRHEFSANEGMYRTLLARAYRDRLLGASDARVNVPPDAPESFRASAAAWERYRQALRDLTGQPGFPFDIEWPVEPA
ncbi:phage tail assembly chaperone [Burkholderia sp. 9120]|uniref:XkdW family protein n=1 Tax=Burkholderia sp. 9120 TaxID=1500897 RepID=UPI00069249AF|nr:phage tail assembly chaperone [Burkholderia sp. 9120]